MITQETKLVKTCGGFNLAILKVNLNPLSWKNRSSYNKTYKPPRSTSYCYPLVKLTDITTCKLRIHGLLSLDFAEHKHPRLWLWDPTQRFSDTNSPVCDSKTILEGLDYQHLWWLEKAATSTIPDLEILQGITPVEDIRELLDTKPKIYKRGTRYTLISLKNSQNPT